MALFHKPACENLQKRKKAMTRIDSQTDQDRDAMLVYKPKKLKDSSLESLYDIDVSKKHGANSRTTKYIILGVIGVVIWIGIIVLLTSL